MGIITRMGCAPEQWEEGLVVMLEESAGVCTMDVVVLAVDWDVCWLVVVAVLNSDCLPSTRSMPTDDDHRSYHDAQVAAVVVDVLMSTTPSYAMAA